MWEKLIDEHRGHSAEQPALGTKADQGQGSCKTAGASHKETPPTSTALLLAEQ
jgi:hypothetical protein